MVLAASNGFCQGTITTVAGAGYVDGIPALQERLDGPLSIAIDPQGNAYLGDATRLLRVDAKTNKISTVAGNGNTNNYADGPATSVSLSGPNSLAWDAKGNLVFLDAARAMRFNPSAGTLTTIAGGYGLTTPSYGIMSGLASDQSGNIFITDSYYDKIYRIDAVTGATATYAGIGGVGNTGAPQGDGGPATLAGLVRPGPITVDSSGNVFFEEQYWLRRIDGKTGIISTLMPITGTASGDGGPVAKASLALIGPSTTDASGNLYISDGHIIRKIDWSKGTIATVAGNGHPQYQKDGLPALNASFSVIYQMVFDTAQNLWIADQGNARVFLVSAATGLVTTVAGTSSNGDGGAALTAVINAAAGLAVDSQNNLYLNAGTSIRKIDGLTGIISALVQIGSVNNSDAYTQGLSLDLSGNLYFVTQDSVQRVTPASYAVTTVAGGNGTGFSGDGGPATSAKLGFPKGVAVDQGGNLYIADNNNNRIRRVDANTGVITTVAGNGVSGQFSVITGSPTQTSIGFPSSIAVSPSGDVCFSSVIRILCLKTDGSLALVAGNGGATYSGDGGSAVLASLPGPQSISFDSSGNLYISDTICHCVRRIAADTGIIQTVAGTGSAGKSPDGTPATKASLQPGVIAMSGQVLYLIDGASLRAVNPATPPALPQPPSITSIVDGVGFTSFYSVGGIVTVLGNYLSAPVPAVAQLGTNGRIGTSLAGVQATFNGIAAPLLYASAAQINAVIPYRVAGGQGTAVVSNASGSSSLNSLFIYDSALNFFPSLIVNPDGTYNSPVHPAPQGAILILYGTGMGQTSPPGVDGAILTSNLPMPSAQFTASIQTTTASVPATIEFLGPLPGFVAGAVQANIQLPPTLPPGLVTLTVVGSDGYRATSYTPISILSGTPVLASVRPSPINVGYATVTLNGANLSTVTTVQLFQNGHPYVPQNLGQMGCSLTACSFTGTFSQAGSFTIQVATAANQVSNQLSFVVQSSN